MTTAMRMKRPYSQNFPTLIQKVAVFFEGYQFPTSGLHREPSPISRESFQPCLSTTSIALNATCFHRTAAAIPKNYRLSLSLCNVISLSLSTNPIPPTTVSSLNSLKTRGAKHTDARIYAHAVFQNPRAWTREKATHTSRPFRTHQTPARSVPLSLSLVLTNVMVKSGGFFFRRTPSPFLTFSFFTVSNFISFSLFFIKPIKQKDLTFFLYAL